MKTERLKIGKVLAIAFFGVITIQAVILAEINRPTLRIGSRGTVVAELQATLKLLGYYDGSVNGIYSESSAIAVSRFQEAAGLKATGIVDSQTWTKLFPSVSSVTVPAVDHNINSVSRVSDHNNQNPESLPLLKEGMEGESVKLLQTRLKALGFYSGVIDGIFGRETLTAVIKAQTSFGIDADGIVGLTTWRNLLGKKAL
jgi:peptidoglycan hydrolase-like protein with peptidoglycan-binding domain